MALSQETGEGTGSVFNTIEPDTVFPRSASADVTTADPVWPPVDAKPIEYLFPDPEPVEEVTTFDPDGRPVDPSAPKPDASGGLIPDPLATTSRAEPKLNFIQTIEDLFNPEKIKSVTAKTASAARDKIKADDAADQSGAMERHRRQMEEARSRSDYIASSIPPPWNEAKESADRIRGPIESFGSLATIFALAASAFTKQPAVNALSAAGAAMSAIHTSDAEGYERAYKAWKDNTELVVKRFNMERQLFQDSEHLFNTDINLWKAKLAANAARFNDQHMLNLLEAGLDGEVFKMMESRTKAIDGMLESSKKFETFNAQRGVITNALEKAEQDHPDWTPQQQAMYKLLVTNEVQNVGTKEEKEFNAYLREYFDKNGEMMPTDERVKLWQRLHTHLTSGGEAARKEALAAELRKENPDMPYAQSIETAEYLIAHGKTKGSEDAKEPARIAAAERKTAQIELSGKIKERLGDKAALVRKEIEEMRQEGANYRTEFSADARAAMRDLNAEDRKELEQMKENAARERLERTEQGKTERAEAAATVRKEIEANKQTGADRRLELSNTAKDAMKHLEIEARKEIEVLKAKQKEQGVSDYDPTTPLPIAREVIAHAIARYDQAPPSPFTMGRPENQTLMARVHTLAPELTGAPYDATKYEGKKTATRTATGAEAAALSNSLKRLTEMATALKPFEETALKNMDVLVNLAKKVDRTGVPIIEKWVRAGRKATGDADVSDFHLQWTLTTPEIARIITSPRLVGQLTDNARQEVHDALSSGASYKQIKRARDLLAGDFTRRRTSTDKELEEIKSQLRGLGKEDTDVEEQTYEGKKYRLKKGTDRYNKDNWIEVK